MKDECLCKFKCFLYLHVKNLFLGLWLHVVMVELMAHGKLANVIYVMLLFC